MKDTEPLRVYLYGIVGSVLAILVVVGVVQEADVELWVALAAAVLAVGTAGEVARAHVYPAAKVARMMAGDELADR